MVHLRALPYWARIGSALGIMIAAYFLVSAVITAVRGVGVTDVLFDVLLAAAFTLLAAAIMAKAGPQSATSVRRSGPLDY
ncbi:hypothetical protein [Pseudarthrobacter sp. efr-133-R2A-89]|uniref:hypothetical protein n=1 Tax=Pseudarthrobacter sp. efr-133-R2A-89 TaxID=3040302 RepID=UPI0025578077|nr:hypothetical protein [Pseudarthrobacter sp. efr-133-R2A-89]